MNKKIIVGIAIALVVYLIFMCIVIIGFNYVRYNSIDQISMMYIREKFLDIDQYGEVLSVNRYLGFPTKKSENLKEVSYSVRTTSNRIIVMVRLQRKNESWEAVDMEIKEVHENAD